MAISRLDAQDYLADVEWPTLVFFMGLFIMVGALVEIGVIGDIASWATDAVGDRYFLASTVLVFASGALSGLVDNIPYVATMAPLVHDLVQAGDGSAGAAAAWWALALGADLGGNATAVGASANVVVLGIAARNGHPISFWQFTKYGLVVAPVHGRHRLAVRRPALLRAGLTRPGTVTSAATPDAAARASRARPSAAPRGSRRTSGRPGRRSRSARGSTARW